MYELVNVQLDTISKQVKEALSKQLYQTGSLFA